MPLANGKMIVYLLDDPFGKGKIGGQIICDFHLSKLVI